MQYDLVILGATVTALGLAETLNNDKKILIINQTEMVAYEYVNTFRLPGIYSKGAEYYKRFHDLEVDILLGSEIIELKTSKECYYLEVFNGTQFIRIKAKMVIDTTENNVDIKEKFLNCLLISKNKERLFKIPSNEQGIFAGITFVHEPDENLDLRIMKVPCPIEMNMLEARHRLIDLWRKRPASLHMWKIATIAFCFEKKLNKPLETDTQNHMVLSSAYFNTPAESYQAGVELGRRLLS